MLKPTIATELRRIQVALAKQTVEYHKTPEERDTPGTDSNPYWYAPNPAFAGFRALVQSPCPIGCPNSILAQELYQQGLACNCNGSGHVLRTAFIKSLDIGMTEGGLVAALGVYLELAFPEELALEAYRQALPVLELRDRLLGMQEIPGDHRVEALTAVAQHLEGLMP